MVQSIVKPTVAYDVPRASEDWTLAQEPVPESQPHDVALDLLKLILARVRRPDRHGRARRAEPRRPLRLRAAREGRG
jgi:hypothetical protein